MELFSCYVVSQATKSGRQLIIQNCLERIIELLPPDSAEYKICRAWISLKQVSSSKQYEGFVTGFCEYVEIAKITNFDILSLSLLVDFQRLSTAEPGESKDYFKNAFSQIIINRLDVTESMKNLVISSLQL